MDEGCLYPTDKHLFVGRVAGFNPTFKPQTGLFVYPDCAGTDLCRLEKRKPTYDSLTEWWMRGAIAFPFGEGEPPAVDEGCFG